MDAAGLFGVYYSLIYLSLSDAIVITFLVPTTTAIAGYLLLGESLSRREILAGGAFLILYGPGPNLDLLVFSFFGVVLIARPEFLFGRHSNNTVPIDGHDVPLSEKGSPAQRLVAVGHVDLTNLLVSRTDSFRSVALVGVLGGTGACRFHLHSRMLDLIVLQ